jgi:hypothetical protein
MKLIEKFIPLPVKLKKLISNDDRSDYILNSEIEEEYEDIDVIRKIDPLEICEYGLTIDDDYPGAEVISVIMKNGRQFNVYTTIKKFELMLFNINL